MDIHVNSRAKRGGDGSARQPYRTISEAAYAARPGDTVLVHPGLYREEVRLKHGGTKDAPLVFESIVKGGAVLTGTEIVEHFLPTEDHGVFLAQIPAELLPEGSAKVFADGKELFHTGTKESLKNCGRGRFPVDAPKDTQGAWYLSGNPAEGLTTLYVALPEAEIESTEIEMTLRSGCFTTAVPNVNYVTVSGFVMKDVCGQPDPAPGAEEGILGCTLSKGWVIEDCDISGTAGTGMTLGLKAMDAALFRHESAVYAKRAEELILEQTMTAASRGFTPEKTGSHLIRRCHIHDCGRAGIAASYGALRSVIRDNHIHHIGQERAQDPQAGILLHCGIDVKLLSNHIEHCPAGICVRDGAQGVFLHGNLLHDNERAGADLLLLRCHGPVTAKSNLFLSETSARINAQGFLFAGNLLAGAFLTGEGKRGTLAPYFLPHTTFPAGVAQVEGGDAYLFDNVFLKEGTESLGAFPDRSAFLSETLLLTEGLRHAPEQRVLPVTLVRNAYFGSAKPSAGELSPLYGNGEVYCQLREELNGRLMLETGYASLLRDSGEEVPGDARRLYPALYAGQAFVEEEDRMLYAEDYSGIRQLLPLSPGPFAAPAEKIPVFDPADTGEEALTDGAAKTLKEAHADSFSCGAALLHCNEAQTEIKGQSYAAQEIFIRGNTAWIRFAEEGVLHETDCAYGITKTIEKWAVEAEQTEELRESEALTLVAKAVVTLYGALNGAGRGAANQRKRLLDESRRLLEPFGITMRLTEGYLKFVRENEKKFLTLEETVRCLIDRSVNFVAEVLAP
ncbi:MAG: right-handed parallel beta-helix repeat-containing protein [Lachnospiraceae bacterium]|nr:right-handed parallel beta-helix repeat-containing protein [Lachnospiraceae bacterium]